MTKGELDRLRAEEKARARLVKCECMKRKRIKQIKEHKDSVLDIMTFGVLVFMTALAFYVDSFGFADVPTWIYVVGIIYIGLYLILNYKRFFD